MELPDKTNWAPSGNPYGPHMGVLTGMTATRLHTSLLLCGQHLKTVPTARCMPTILSVRLEFINSADLGHCTHQYQHHVSPSLRKISSLPVVVSYKKRLGQRADFDDTHTHTVHVQQSLLQVSEVSTLELLPREFEPPIPHTKGGCTSCLHPTTNIFLYLASEQSYRHLNTKMCDNLANPRGHYHIQYMQVFQQL